MERQALQRAREAFLSGRTRAVEFRLQQLHALQKMITEKETDISSALKQDINRVRGNMVGSLRELDWDYSNCPLSCGSHKKDSCWFY